MAIKKHDFLGKEVADAIKEACDTLNVPQERLDIEVLETGTTGIFGLIRKKAKIRVSVKEESEFETIEQEIASMIVSESTPPHVAEAADSTVVPADEQEFEPEDEPEEEQDEEQDEEQQEDADSTWEEQDDKPGDETDAGSESLEVVRSELASMVELMGFPSTVEVTAKGLAVHCAIEGEYQDELSGPEGKTLDSIQYILRKIAAKKCPERLRISVNVGNFREERLEELKARAVEYAALVKENGKTQVLPALNPSERREIHMVLQEDKEVRSRSVGDGLFKKILIYKPGKSTRGGRRKTGGRNTRRGKPRSGGKKPKNEE